MDPAAERDARRTAVSLGSGQDTLSEAGEAGECKPGNHRKLEVLLKAVVVFDINDLRDNVNMDEKGDSMKSRTNAALRQNTF